MYVIESHGRRLQIRSMEVDSLPTHVVVADVGDEWVVLALGTQDECLTWSRKKFLTADVYIGPTEDLLPLDGKVAVWEEGQEDSPASLPASAMLWWMLERQLAT